MYFFLILFLYYGKLNFLVILVVQVKQCQTYFFSWEFKFKKELLMKFINRKRCRVEKNDKYIKVHVKFPLFIYMKIFFIHFFIFAGSKRVKKSSVNMKTSIQQSFKLFKKIHFFFFFFLQVSFFAIHKSWE